MKYEVKRTYEYSVIVEADSKTNAEIVGREQICEALDGGLTEHATNATMIAVQVGDQSIVSDYNPEKDIER